MNFAIAWGIYLLMAALLQAGFERYLAPLLPQRFWRIGLRTLLAIVLFTPGVVAVEGALYLVPACIGVLYNILAKSGPGFLKALLPLLLSTTLVFGLLFVLEWRRQRAADAGDAGDGDDSGGDVGPDDESGRSERRDPSLR